EEDLVFCFSCCVYGSGQLKSDNFFSIGFNNWKKAIEKFREHQKTSYYEASYMKWLRKETLQESVLTQVNKQHKSEVEKNRENLTKIIKTIIFFGKQGLAFHFESKDSNNKGNFREFISFISINFDHELNSFVSRNLNANYLSADIQNEILQFLGSSIRSQIIDNVKENLFYSIVVDGTSDITTQEQISFCVRYCNSLLEIKEHFIGFFQDSNLNINFLTGQCYDGAANMSGEYKGLSSRIKEDSPSAIYVHCYAHRLNLALQESCESLKEEIDKIDRDCLANTLCISIRTFDFIFYTEILTYFFKIPNILSLEIQNINLDYSNMKELADSTVEKLNGLKSQEFYDQIWEVCLKKSSSLGVELPSIQRLIKKPK
ncbi:unnamed protein product, partial [Brachionus calyciflorus]